MFNYISVTYTTCNEADQQEITTERYRTISELAWATLHGDFALSKTVTKKYVAVGTRWVEKDTGVVPGHDTQYELYEIKGHLKRMSSHEF